LILVDCVADAERNHFRCLLHPDPKLGSATMFHARMKRGGGLCVIILL
jgi:hypothetical protein